MFTLDQAYRALDNHDEFVIKRYDGLICLDYIVCFPGSFHSTEEDIQRREAFLLDFDANGSRGGFPELKTKEDFRSQAEKDCREFAWMRRNMRGITFSEAGELVSLPFHKFFNVNQIEETQFEKIRDCKAIVYEKMDGSMIHCFVHPRTGELQTATCRGTETIQAQESLKILQKDSALTELVFKTIMDGWTPIFEFVAPHNPIVVHYPKSRLVYLISRHRRTGEYFFDERFPDKANRFQFEFGQIFDNLGHTNFEGYVCHLDNGMIVKAKTQWYMERHRAVDALMRPAYKLYQIVFEGVMDDLLAMAPDHFKPVLTKIYQEAQSDLLAESLRLEKLFHELNANFGGLSLVERAKNKEVRKSFVELVQKEAKEDFSELMSIFSRGEPGKNVKLKLLEKYRVKYPNRVLSDLEDDV